MRQLHNELSKSFFLKHEKEKSKLIEIHFLKEGGRDLKEKKSRGELFSFFCAGNSRRREKKINESF